MPGNQIRFAVRFFKTATGNEPDAEWFRSLDPAYKKIIGDDLRKIQYGFPQDLPRNLCKFLREGLFECRTDLPGHNIARVIFCVSGSEIFILNAFIKKTQKTPQHEIEVALDRKRELGL
jgi:phage-related protein